MRIHIVPHQHFDLVWRRPVAWYRRRREALYDQVFRMLEEYPSFTFSFSQTMPLREYVGGDRERKKRVARFLEEGRLEWIGGSLSIPDLNLSSAMSVVWNIQEGRRYWQEEFGYTVRVGAFEDAFGVPSQLPQLLRECGYSYYKAGRMPHERGVEPPGRFLWKGQDGAVFRCVANTPGGMSWGWGCPDNPDEPSGNPEQRREKLRRELEEAIQGARRSGLSEALVTVMGEEHDLCPDIVPLVESLSQVYAPQGIQVGFSTHLAYCESIRDWEKAPVFGPEDDFSRIFTGCYVTRNESKRLPRQVENIVHGALNGGAEIPEGIWENLSLLQFHDAICGCHIPENGERLREIGRASLDALASLPQTLPWRPLLPSLGAEPGASREEISGEVVHGGWRIFGGSGIVEGLQWGGLPVPVPQLVAREEHGTLWTEEYGESPSHSLFQASRSLFCREGEVLSLRTEFSDAAFRQYWPGFSRVRAIRILRLHRECPWMEVDLHLDFLGNSTEFALRLSLPGEQWREGEGDSLFGTCRRTEYPRAFPCGDAFPVSRFLFFGNRFLWLNENTPSHAFRQGGMENLLLRSPVKRWAPWFPVTPETFHWDNGPREYHFALCGDAGAYCRGEWHRLGMEFPLATRGISWTPLVPPGWEMLPKEVVPAGKDREGAWWFFNASGQSQRWERADMTFGPWQLRREKHHG